MPQSQDRAWWADVQDVRETIERRRAAEHAATSAPARRAGAGATTAEHEHQRSRGPARARRRRPGARRPLHLPAEPVPAGRRTVEITGRPAAAPRLPAGRAHEAGAAAGPGLDAPARRRRPSPSPAERLAHRPDRIAAWAAVLGFAMMVIAAL